MSVQTDAVTSCGDCHRFHCATLKKTHPMELVISDGTVSKTGGGTRNIDVASNRPSQDFSIGASLGVCALCIVDRISVGVRARGVVCCLACYAVTKSVHSAIARVRFIAGRSTKVAVLPAFELEEKIGHRSKRRACTSCCWRARVFHSSLAGVAVMG